MKNSSENTNLYEVVISRRAGDFFEDASASLQKKLDRCFDRLKVDPRNYPNIKPLKGNLAGYYRYRVGDYRVIYSINDEQRRVIVSIIAHRRDVYE